MVPKAVGVVSVLVLALLGCQGDDGAEGVDVAPATAAPVTAAPATTGPVTTTTASEPSADTPAAADDCAVGAYVMVSPEFWVNVAQAGGEGGTGVTLGGDPRLTLDAEGSATIAFDNWQFRLSFPDSSETVKGTQDGTVTGTWGRDDYDAVRLTATTDDLTVSFVLEAAQGDMAVPSGGALGPGVGTFAVSADCTTGRLELQAAEFVWPFQRR